MVTRIAMPTHGSAMVQRDELLGRLQAGEYRRLTVIEGPGGFGKTTLGASWRQRLLARGKRVAWVDAVDRQEDTSRFYRHIVASLIDAGCPVSEGLMSLYREEDNGKDSVLVQALADEIAQSDRDVFLFIDDFHFLSRERTLSGLQTFLAVAPDNLHFVLLGRTSPQLQFRHLEFVDQLNLINTNDLRLSFVEVKKFIEKRVGWRVEDDVVQEVHNVTEGWAAAIQMVAISLSKGHGKEQFDIAGGHDSPEGIIYHLANQTYELLPHATRQFLKAVSILDRFCPDMCRHVTGREDAHALIDELMRQNYFLFPLESPEGWYRLHHIYIQFLRKRISEDICRVAGALGEWQQSKEGDAGGHGGQRFLRELSRRTAGILDVQDLHRRAGEWLSDVGHTSDAIAHYILAGDDALAIELLEGSAWELIAAGRMGYFLNCVDGLQRETVGRSLILSEAKGFAHLLTCDIESARRELKRLDADEDVTDEAHVFARETLRAGIGLYTDSLPATIALMQFWPPKGDPFVQGAACNIVMWGKILSGRFSEARLISSYARVDDAIRGSYFPKVYRYCFYGLIREQQGGLKEAETHYKEALRISEQTSGMRSAPACIAATYLCGVLYERGEFGECGDLLHGRSNLLQEMLPPDALLRATTLLARLACRERAFDAAMQHIQRLVQHASERKLRRIQAAALCEMARVCLFLGTGQQAIKEVLEAMHACRADAAAHEQSEIEHRILKASVWQVLAGGVPRKEMPVAACERWFAGVTSAKARIDVALTVAQHWLVARNTSEAESWARRAVALSQPGGYLATLEDHLLELCAVGDRTASCYAEYVSSTGLDLAAERAYATMRGAESGGQESGRPVPDGGGDGAAPTQVDRLSGREAKVLGLAGEGYTTRQIGETLFISENTVKYHFRNIFQKLGVRNRRSAVVRARISRLI